MTGCIPDWTELFKKALKHLKPGGWVEHVELWGIAKSDDDTLKPDSPLKTWVDVFEKIGAASGKTFFWGDKAADSVREAGFVGVTQRTVKVPIGTWPKDKRLKQWGMWNRQFLLDALEGFSIRGLTELLGVGSVPYPALIAIFGIRLTGGLIAVDVRGRTGVSHRHSEGAERPESSFIS